jgi:hypothetical protein
MNPTETAKILAICTVAYPQYPVTKETVGIYADLLADLDYVQVEKAVRDLLKTTDKWLSVAAIRRKVAENGKQLAPSKALAWSEVREAAHNEGRNSRPNWSHPAVAEAVKSIGWWDICNSTNLDTVRSQFWRCYEEIVKEHDNAVLTTEGRLALTAGRPHLAALEG